MYRTIGLITRTIRPILTLYDVWFNPSGCWKSSSWSFVFIVNRHVASHIFLGGRAARGQLLTLLCISYGEMMAVKMVLVRYLGVKNIFGVAASRPTVKA